MGMRKNRYDIDQLRRSGLIAAEIVDALGKMVAPGVSAQDLEERARELCREHGVQSSFFGYQGYKYFTCISVNEEVVHAIPYASKMFADGDLVKVDFGVVYNGYYSDHCRTFAAGKPSADHQKLLDAGKAATDNAVKMVKAGNRIGDLAYAMQSTAEEQGFSVVRSYVGHGIGKKLHEAPEIPAFGRPGTGQVLQEDMVLCVECQVVEGSDALEHDRDGWTTRTKDGGWAVMFEQMVRVTASGVEIFTQRP